MNSIDGYQKWYGTKNYDTRNIRFSTIHTNWNFGTTKYQFITKYQEISKIIDANIKSKFKDFDDCNEHIGSLE